MATERIRGAFAMREAAVRGVQVLPGPVGLDWRAIEVPAWSSSKPGSIRIGICRPCRAMSIVCRVRRRRVPTARSTGTLASCVPRTHACTRPRAVSATGRDGSLLSTCAAFAVDSAWRANTNKRNTSVGTLGLLPLVHSASKGLLVLGPPRRPRRCGMRRAGWADVTGRNARREFRVTVIPTVHIIKAATFRAGRPARQRQGAEEAFSAVAKPRSVRSGKGPYSPERTVVSAPATARTPGLAAA